MKYRVIETRTVPTVQFEINEQPRVFHSKYDPLKEAEAWAKKAVQEIQLGEPILIFGLAAGYHVSKLSEYIPNEQISVIELNEQYEQWLKTTSLYQPLLQRKNVQIISVQKALQLLTSIHQNNILVQRTSMDIVPSQYSSVKELLDDIHIQKESIKKQVGNMVTNFEKNILLKDPGIGELRDKYNGKKMILVSAGPSLDKQLPLLKQIRDEREIIIASVGTALKPLLKAGITPDFFMIIDPNKSTKPQLENVELPTTPLFYLSTAYHETILLHKGPRRIVWQNGFSPAQDKAAENQGPFIQTGGSVATALLDTMVYLGGKKIALVGQDLAYTDGKSHASHTAAGRTVGNSMITTKSFDQSKEVMTSKNLTIYRKWFENYSAQHNQSLSLYNCTEGGAYINNWNHMRLKEFHQLAIK